MRLPLAIFAAAILVPGAALAQSSVVERLLALSREANQECQRQQLPEPALGAACQSARSYDKALAGLGFCFDDELGEWTGCAVANRPPATAPQTRQEPPQAPQAGGPEEPSPQATEPTPDENTGENYDLPDTGHDNEPGKEPETAQQEEPDLAPIPPPQTDEPPPPDIEVPLKPSDSGWRSYANGRFGTVVDVPPTFEPRTNVENGDGQTFASPDDESEVAVYGSLLESQSMQQYRNWYRSELSGKSYEAGGTNWFVISGTAEGKIYYVKVVRTAHCGVPVVHHMVFRYPLAQKRRYDRVVERLADSLHGTTQSSYCQG